MSGRDWLPNPPVGVALVVAAALAMTAALNEYEQNTACTYRPTARECQQGPQSLEPIRVPPIVGTQTPPRDPNPEREKWRTESDLIAQWEMADWAKASALAAWIALIITGVGVIFVARTLEATRDAVKEAAKASEAGLLASDAAKTAAEASVAAERARFFLVINKHNIDSILYDFAHPNSGVLTIHSKTSLPSVAYCFRNYGKTPAIIREISVGMMLSSEPVIPVYPVIITSFPEHMIGGSAATEEKTIEFDAALSSSQASAISRNQARLWFFGRIDYRDVFGEAQVHRFYFRTVMLNGECILQPYDFEHYNEST